MPGYGKYLLSLNSTAVNGDVFVKNLQGGTFACLAVKCQAMENTYSKNSSVIPQKFNIYRSCIKSSISILKYS
jgi:hypothetical protein